MGKTLTIHGVDWSNVAVAHVTPVDPSSVWTSIPIVTGGLNLADVSLAGAAYANQNRLRVDSTILIPSGKTLKIRGLKGTSGEESALRFSYFWYRGSHSPISETKESDYLGCDATIGTLSTYFMNNVGGGDTFELTNDKGSNLYFTFTFALQNTSERAYPSRYTTVEYQIE